MTDVISTGEAVTFWILGPIALLGGAGHGVRAQRRALGAVPGDDDALPRRALHGPAGAVPRLRADHRLHRRRDDAVPVRAHARRAATAPTRWSRCCAASGSRRWSSASGSRCCWSARWATRFTDIPSVGLAAGNAGAGGNVTGIGRLIFTKYLFAFELTSALLITAALGAMVLAYAQSRGAQSKIGQRATVEARLRGEHDRISPLPGPGVFATGNSVAVPAILPDGSVAPESISAIIDATPIEEAEHARGRRARPHRPRPHPEDADSEPHQLPAALGAAVHDRRGRRARAPQRDRRVHVHRADAQRGQPLARHVRPASTGSSTGRSWRSS